MYGVAVAVGACSLAAFTIGSCVRGLSPRRRVAVRLAADSLACCGAILAALSAYCVAR